MAHIDERRLTAFRVAFKGDIVLPADDGYDAARAVWNGMIDRRPAIVVRPAGAADVATAVRFGRDAGLLIAVRSGGHSIPGLSTCDDGIVIDLSLMRGVIVDPVARVARCEGGAHLGDLDDSAQAHGLACNAGTVSHTGVAGLTLGGGMGRLQRKLGLTVDSLRCVDVVTADGRLVRASADENADLFWGMRGAGANFGIVTAFEFDLAPIGPVITRGILVHPAERAQHVVAGFQDFMRSAPDEVMASLFIGRATPADRYPASIAGRPIAAVSVTYVGPPSDAARVLKPLTDLGEPVSGSLGQQTHLESQHANDEALDWGHRVYTKSGFLSSLPPDLVDALMGHAETGKGDDVFSIWAFGGAIGRVPDEAMAFTGRTAPYWIGAETVWDDAAEDAAHIGWARDGMALTQPYRVTGGYVNDVSETGDDAVVRAVYGDAKYERLVVLKRTWDPDNVFRLNQNIRP